MGGAGAAVGIALVSILAISVFVLLLYQEHQREKSTTTPMLVVRTNAPAPKKTTMTTVGPALPPMRPGGSGLQFTLIINWWDNDSPSKAAERLGFAPNIGGFYDVTDSWPADRFRSEVDQIVAMRNKYKTLWTPIQFDVAILPRGGLANFEKMLGQIGASFKEAEQRGIRCRSRALTEMNGDWFPYSTGNYEEIKGILRKFYTAIKSQSPTSTVMWNPNFSFGGCGTGDRIDARNYDPGSQYWDEAGLDIYRHNARCQNIMPTGSEIRDGIDACEFYNYVKGTGKPFLVAETSRATKLGDCGTPPANFDFESKSNWLAQLFDTNLKTSHQLLYNVSWFDYLKQEDGELRDFRMSFDPKLVAQLRRYMGLA